MDQRESAKTSHSASDFHPNNNAHRRQLFGYKSGVIAADDSDYPAKHGYNAAMVKLCKPGRLTIWIACFAILLNALAPSISYAMFAMHAKTAPSGTSSFLMEVCTAHGTELIVVAAEKTADAPLKSNGDPEKNPAPSGHCPFCLTHNGTFALLPTGAIRFAVSAKQGLMPPLYYQSTQPLFSWAVAHSRAPPVAS